MIRTYPSGTLCSKPTYTIGIHFRVCLIIGDLDSPQTDTEGKYIVELRFESELNADEKYEVLVCRLDQGYCTM